MKSIDTTNMCSHLQRKLFYRDGKKILVLAGKSAPKIIYYFSATGNTSIASITRNNNTGHF